MFYLLRNATPEQEAAWETSDEYAELVAEAEAEWLAEHPGREAEIDRSDE